MAYRTKHEAKNVADREARAGRTTGGLAMAVALDVVAVLIFVAIGRNNHDEGTAVAGVVETAAPFLIALVVAWATAWKLHLASLRAGLVVWPLTVALGMVLRRTVFDRGTAAAFVIVATVFLGATLIGWRALAAWRGRSAAGAAPQPG